MKGRSLLFLLMLFGLSSCAEEVIQKPKDLIAPKKMEEILYDLALLQAGKNTNPGVLEEHGIETMPFLYKKHGIDSAQFVNSDIYYASRPLEYEAMYSRVEERLQREKEALEEERTRVSDSIRKVAEKRRAQQAEKDSLDGL